MQYLYAPWRSEYFEKEKSECPFCDCANKIKSDEELGVIFRAKYCFGVMNRYPYSAGHFMIIPYLHEEHIENLSDEAWQEISQFARRYTASRVRKKVSAPLPSDRAWSISICA